ncbi:hypothetical protein NY78_3518 [Desulfovibrio sp. TomC]|nr:hypothetical protein NY78_3518 [Desulfovibrio sp. TomC]
MDSAKFAELLTHLLELSRDEILKTVVISSKPLDVTSHSIFKNAVLGILLHLGEFVGINIPLVELDDEKTSKKAVTPRQRFAAGHNHGTGKKAPGQRVLKHPLTTGGIPLSTENTLRLFLQVLVTKRGLFVAQVGKVVDDEKRILGNKGHDFEGVLGGGPVAGQVIVELPSIVALAKHGQLGLEGPGRAVKKHREIKRHHALERGQVGRPQEGENDFARVHLGKSQAGLDRLDKCFVVIGRVNGDLAQARIFNGDFVGGGVHVGANRGAIRQVGVSETVGGFSPARVAHDRLFRHHSADHANRQGQEVLHLLDGIDHGERTVLTDPAQRVELVGRNTNAREGRTVAKGRFDKEINLGIDAVGDSPFFNNHGRKVTKLVVVVVIPVNLRDTPFNNAKVKVAVRIKHVNLLLFAVGSLLPMTPL